MKNNDWLWKKHYNKMMITLVIYFGLFAVGLVLGWMFYGFNFWTGDELLYKFGVYVADRIPFIFIVYFIIGIIFIPRFYFKKVYGYLQEVVLATNTLYSEDDKFIELSEPLKPLENQLNSVKVANLNNLRAAKVSEQRKNDLVAYLAHDLKTPITSVIGYLTLLRDESDISMEMRGKYTDISLKKAQRLDELINEFFEITRFNITNIELEKREVSISRMLTQLVFEFQPMLKEKNLTCDLDCPDKLMMVCDGDKLSRVFDNLLKNAVNYCDLASTINISAREEDENIYIAFTNKGITIPKEKLDRLFQQFYRLDSARSSKSGGSGLGLAIAKEIVQLHGGSIHAESFDNVIVFKVILPSGVRNL